MTLWKIYVIETILFWIGSCSHISLYGITGSPTLAEYFLGVHIQHVFKIFTFKLSHSLWRNGPRRNQSALVGALGKSLFILVKKFSACVGLPVMLNGDKWPLNCVPVYCTRWLLFYNNSLLSLHFPWFSGLLLHSAMKIWYIGLIRGHPIWLP